MTGEEARKEIMEIMFESYDHPSIAQVIEGPGYQDIILKSGVHARIRHGTIDPDEGFWAPGSVIITVVPE